MAAKFCPQCGSPTVDVDRFCASCGAPLSEESEARTAVARNPKPAATSRLLSPLVLGAIALAGVFMIAAGLLLRDEATDVSMSLPTVAAQPTSVAIQPTVVQATASLPFPDISRIALQDAQSRLEVPGVVFIDVRAREEYNAAHIPGAVSIPLGATEMDAAYQELPLDAEIITYCT